MQCGEPQLLPPFRCGYRVGQLWISGGHGAVAACGAPLYVGLRVHAKRLDQTARPAGQLPAPDVKGLRAMRGRLPSDAGPAGYLWGVSLS